MTEETSDTSPAEAAAAERGKKLMLYFDNGEAASETNESAPNNGITAPPTNSTANIAQQSTKDAPSNHTPIDPSGKDETTSSNNLVAEAERQAAIAAALSQASSTPSIVAGMARQFQLNNSEGGGYGGTVVALPPLDNGELADPVPMQMVWKPVKFDCVRVAFDRIWREEFDGLDEEDGGDDDGEGQLEVEPEVIEDGASRDEINMSSSNAMGITGEGAGAEASTNGADEQSEHVNVSENDETKPPAPAALDETASTLAYVNLNKSDSTAQKQKQQPTIPDSFLRFLLLIAKVPIIVEEGKQLHRSKQRSLQNSETNALNAAKRALEIYKCAKEAYIQISQGNSSKNNNSSAEDDATSAFFASCSGEDSIVNNNTSSPPPSSVREASPKSPKRQQRRSLADMGSPAATALSSASSMLSSVMSKVSKKQHDFGKKFHQHKQEEPSTSPHNHREDVVSDYEIIIDQEMLGLTVENVLERTIIRTLLPEGAAKRSGAKIGSLIAKVGNVDTSNLTHFETIDELRQSQRPLKLTLRHISSDVLRCAREEMGRLIRGREEEHKQSAIVGENNNDKPWRVASSAGVENFDTILRERWPSKAQRSTLNAAALPSSIMTRNEMIHRAGKDLIRILALLVVGMEKELSDVPNSASSIQSHGSGDVRTKHLHEAIEITSKILLEYAKQHPDVEDKFKSDRGSSSHGSSFYPVPPGRVGKKNAPPPPKGQKGKKKALDDTPLLRIGDALQRTTSFLVDPSSTTATALRWEIIDYLCMVLDLDSENELAEKEAASSTDGGDASQINDLGSAGSILKLIVVNCSTGDDTPVSVDSDENMDADSVSSLGQASSRSSGHNSHSGNPFLSVVHRLAASKSTSARVSACSLGPVLWSHLDFPRQLQLRGVITRALHDVDLTVRKSTATVLHEVAELVFDRRSVPWLVLMCERSMTDPEPQLRAAAMTLTWHLAEHLPNAFLGDASKGSRSLRRLPPRTDPTFMDVYLLQCKLLPVASNLAEDKMPSVRLSVAAQCDRLCSAMGEHWFSVIIDLLQALLSDADERVRSEAVLCMPRLVESVVVGTSKGQTITVLESLLPQALKIQKDSSPEVRAALAAATGELLIFLVGAEDNNNDLAPPSPGRGALSNPSQYKKYVDETLIPILQKLLQDSNPEVTTASLRAVTNASRSSTNSTARIPSTSHNFDSVDDDLQSISSHQSHQSHTSYDRRKPVFIPVLSEEQVLRLLPTLSNLATSREWRVRQSAVEIVPALLGCTYQHETRHEISKFCLKLMSDKVDAVRKTAAECLCLGGSSLARHGEDDGGAWINNIVLPHLKICSQSEDSKQRLLCLKMIEIIITNGLCPSSQRVESKMDISLNSSFDTASDSVYDTDSPVKMILDVAAPLAADKVANVRLNVGRVFGSVVMLLDKPDADFAVSMLEKQLEEEKVREGGGDCDVLYFAQQAIAIFQSPRRLSSYDVVV
ncbi:hypothetical protein ACHAWO_004589 [Cyclotella atomus]|uniref:PDZ domain-containing protein n=1 Tax=Cyclotella atomus TaxID=382360 RepID=A0ABD3QES4_9STRA